MDLDPSQATAQAFDIIILDAEGYETSSLFGNPIFNEQDEKIGSIKEIIMTTDGNCILAAEIGPIIGERRKTVLFPYLRIKKMAAFGFPRATNLL
jgi:sporulation protein YlmC with PRC-barrel domain